MYLLTKQAPRLVSKMPFIGARYVWPFRENGIDGEMLLRLDESELNGLGMDNKLHVKRFLIEQEALRHRTPGYQTDLSALTPASEISAQKYSYSKAPRRRSSNRGTR